MRWNRTRTCSGFSTTWAKAQRGWYFALLVACGCDGGIGPRAISPLKSKLDLLFVIDNAGQAYLTQGLLYDQVPSFIDALTAGSPAQDPLDLHVGVVSSSFGAGAWGNVNSCEDGVHPGDDQGFLLQGAGGVGTGSCSMLHVGETFLQTRDGVGGPNFDGDVRDAVKCMVTLGDNGCFFGSPFESTYFALTYAALSKAAHPQNGGFLRTDALLGIVMLTPRDDCSVGSRSLLLDPAILSAADPSGLGVIGRYRCNEFGHLCDGAPPPHDAPPAGGLILQNCVSAENAGKTDPLVVGPDGQPDPTHGHLWPTVKEFSDHIRSFKNDPNDIVVAAIAGPPTPYQVVPMWNLFHADETVPSISHSCVSDYDSGASTFADPAVRIHQWVESFGANGVFYPICAHTLQTAVTGIANKLHAKLMTGP